MVKRLRQCSSETIARAAELTNAKVGAEKAAALRKNLRSESSEEGGRPVEDTGRAEVFSDGEVGSKAW